MAEEIYGFDESKSKVTLKSGAGITVGEDGTIGHTNEMEASASYVGGTTAVPMIKIDEQGHVVALTKQTIYPPTSAGTSGQVWTSDGAGAGKWADPAGGEEWEEVDLSNFPKDWVAGDRVKIVADVYSADVTVSSWTSKPTAITPSEYVTGVSPILEFEIASVSSKQEIYDSNFSNYVLIISLYVPKVSDMNNNTKPWIAYLAFNGGGNITNIKTGDIIKKMWRLKQ